MSTNLLNPKKKPAPKVGANGRKSLTRPGDIVINGSAHIPPWVKDHDSFRRWSRSDAFPKRGKFFYFDGELWVDLSMETAVHNQIKTIIAIVVGSIVLNEALGRYVCDRMMLANVAAALSGEPDGMFISNESFARGFVTLEEGDQSLEIVGTPDMTLEVISKTSVSKDMGTSMDRYAKAGVAEYWLVDSTIETPELIILRLVAGKYVTARKHDGWVKSKVFGRSFRLRCKKDAKGVSHFNLETK